MSPSLRLRTCALSTFLLVTCSSCSESAKLPPNLSSDGGAPDGTSPSTGATEANGDPNAAGFSHVSAEFMTTAEVDAQLETLARAHVDVTLAWPLSDFDDAERWKLVRRAHELGIQVHPWPLLPMEKGYWANSVNAADIDQGVREILAAWEREKLPPARLVIDMEPPVDRALALAKATVETPTEVIGLMKKNVDRAQYAQATQTYKAMVAFAQARGWKVEVSTLPDALADYVDGDDDIRQALNIPLDDIPWDVVTIQAYRTLAKHFTPSIVGDPTDYYVFEMGERARKVFGSRAGLIIGLTDPGDVQPETPTYESPAALQKDLNAAVAAGFARDSIGLYALRGLVRKPPPASWLLRADSSPSNPSVDATSVAILGAAASLDTLL